MADKPSRALVIYGDGLAPMVLPSHGNLHSFASLAVCGFLALRASPPSETEDERIIRDFTQLLDAYDSYQSEIHGEHKDKAGYDTLSDRFMGLRAALFSSCPGIQSFGRKLGFCILHDDELVMHDNSSNEALEEVPGNFSIASQLLHLLGFSGSDVIEKYDFDLVFLHITSCENSRNKKEVGVSNMDANGVNDLVGNILKKAHPGSTFGLRLHFSVLLSYGCVSEDEKLCSLLSSPTIETNSDLSLLLPIQSYTLKGGHRLDDIRHHHAMLLAQWQEGLTRRDMTKAFFFEDFKVVPRSSPSRQLLSSRSRQAFASIHFESGTNLAILADRFLHEIAFKLWKASKYGA